jgi:hypothetical protein
MNSLSFIECCHLLAIDPKTLRQWLVQAPMSLHAHPTDARIKCLTGEQVHVLANLHDRVLPLPVEALDVSPTPSEAQHQMPADAGLRAKLVQMEAQVATLQAQLTDLAFQLLQEREQHTEQRNRLIPLIEYGARGHYVLICPEAGELHITPDSPEWFVWLASLTSFRFVGQTGRFSARRGYNRRPNRGWYAQRGIHQKNYSKYIGVSEHITTERLEQIAAYFQSYMQ